MEIFDIAAILIAAIGSTVAVFVWISYAQSDLEPQRLPADFEQKQRIAFLFEDEDLNHSSDTAARLYQLIPGQDQWSTLREKMENRFPSLPKTAAEAGPGKTTIPARHLEDSATLSLTRNGQFLRVNMLEEGRQTPAQVQQLKTLQRELDHLRRASDTTPHAIWQVNADGVVAWYNAAYQSLYQRLYNRDPDKNRPVFEINADPDTQVDTQRVATQPFDGEQKDWYDVSAVSVGDMTILHAVDVNAIVKSEVAQRNFVQTLAKTFAQLSIGLAIFDRNGQLALFNPALIDLTDLPAEFLSGRPTLISFFDRIRENRRMPEPKNYQSWRQQITEVIAAATDGRYQETWTLETGQTYRVKGRPHPDGAIAFLIEDISAEVSLTRNFRAELELGQSLMDTFDDSLAVFSSTGVLTFCNLAYRELWGIDPENTFADVTVHDCVTVWKGLCKHGVRWTEMSDFILDFGERTSWEMPVTMVSGKKLICSVSRIGSGATVVRFSAVKDVPRTTGNKKSRSAKS